MITTKLQKIKVGVLPICVECKYKNEENCLNPNAQNLKLYSSGPYIIVQAPKMKKEYLPLNVKCDGFERKE